MRVSTPHALYPLFELSKKEPSRQILTFVDDQGQDVETRTVSEFVKRVEQLTSYLLDGCGLKKGDVALLLYPPSMEFIEAFAACLTAGIVAAPVYPPNLSRPENDLIRLHAIAETAGAKAILTNRSYRWASRVTYAKDRLAGRNTQWPALPWYVTQGLRWFRPSSEQEYPSESSDVAVLQFTSGSTSIPKGVRLTHRNLVHQLDFNADTLKMKADSRFVMWVPQYHDLGLISGILSVLRGNGSLWFMSPLSFLRRPALWFETIHRVRGTHTASPNFGYELITRKTTPEQRSQWDLSSLQLFMSAAEPIVPRVVDQFVTAFKSNGLSEQAFCPAYGLAEHTVGVTVSGRGRIKIDRKTLVDQQWAKLDAVSGDLEIMGCGSPAPGVKVKIVCSNSQNPLKDNYVGEVWVQSDSVADGYEGLEELSQSTFHNIVPGETGRWLKTGDLGFLYDGELFITGRKKDLIILCGRNYHPEDIEEAIRNSHSAIRPGGVAAFSVPGDATEKLVVVIEILDSHSKLNQEVAAAVRKKVSEIWQVQATIGLLHPKSIKKTTSGKIQRAACRKAWMENQFDLVEIIESPTQIVPATLNALPMKTQLNEIQIEDRIDSLIEIIRTLAQSKISQDISKIGMDDYLHDSGLDSMTSAEIIMLLEETLQHRLPAALFIEHPTLRSAAMRVLSELGIEHLGVETKIREQEPMFFRPPHRGMSPAQTRVGIIGGGVGGLVSALELVQLGYKNIVIFEASDQCGGKVKTVQTDHGAFELGQNFFNDTFHTILGLAREMRCEIVPTGHKLSIWDEEFGFEDGPSRNPCRTWSQAVVRAAKLTMNPFLPFPSMTEELDRSFTDFIKAHGLNPPPPLFKFDWNGMGYGLEMEAPASHVLSYLQVVGQASNSCYLKNGNQELWTKLASHLEKNWGVTIRYNAQVESVIPDSVGVTIQENGRKDRFEEIILAVPPDVLQKLLPNQDPLQELLQEFEYYGYTIQSFKTKDCLEREVTLLPQFAETQGKPILIGFCPGKGNWYLSGHISAPHGQKIAPLSPEDLKRELAETIQQMGGQVESFGPAHTWTYFPHLRKNSSQVLRQVEAHQGSHHLWFTGSWISFETTEHVARHAQHLVQTCFDPAFEIKT